MEDKNNGNGCDIEPFTRIPNRVLEALCQVGLSGCEYRVFLTILRKTFGFNQQKAWVSQNLISDITGIQRCNVSRAIRRLKKENMITYGKAGSKRITGVCDPQEWRLLKTVSLDVKQVSNLIRIGIKTDTKQVSNLIPIKETLKENNNRKDSCVNPVQYVNNRAEKKKEREQIGEVISYLNEKAEKNFKADTRLTVENIRARLNEGFGIEDFKKVIDTKTLQWKTDNKMNRFLRPVTLFGNKFEGYLNEDGNGNGKNKSEKHFYFERDYTEKQYKNLETIYFS